MRVLILLLLLSILLAWCGNDNVKLKGYQHTIKTGSLNLKSDVELDKNKSHSGTVDVTNTSMSGRKLVENKFQQNNQYTAMDDDIKKFTKLSSLLTWSGWYKINCKKEFVTERMRKECQLKQLEELSYLCDIPELWINLSNIDKYFDSQKFDLVNRERILKSKESCKHLLEEDKKSAVFQNKLRQKIENFKLDDCIKLSGDLRLLDLPPTKELELIPSKERRLLIANAKKEFVKKCQIGFILNYKGGDCSLLKAYGLNKICVQIKRDIDFYRRLQTEEREYGAFNLESIFLNR